MKNKETYTSVTSTSSTFTGEDCSHANGWYFSIKGWFSNKRYFWCDDCKSVLRVRKNGLCKK